MIKASRVAVQTTATKLSVDDPIDSFQGQTIAVKNTDQSKTVYLGGPDVTIYDGYPLYSGEQIAIELEQPQKFYAVSTGEAEVAVLWLDLQ